MILPNYSAHNSMLRRFIRAVCRSVWLWWPVVLLVACRDQDLRPDEITTRIPSVEMMATYQMMTENAPPPGFRDAVSFPLIDNNLPLLSDWRYESRMQFDGVFARTPRQVTATASANVWYRQLGNYRRVVVTGMGDLLGQEGVTELEGVRLGDDTFLVRDHVCAASNTEAAALAANLRAGDLIGGVANAVPDGARATINGEDVWRYTFTVNDLELPQLQLDMSSLVVMTSGELWIAPEHNVVIRFYVNLDVENGMIRLFDNTLPLTGTLLLRYDLYDIGIDPNITQPYGC